MSLRAQTTSARRTPGAVPVAPGADGRLPAGAQRRRQRASLRRLGDYGVAGVPLERALYEARSTLITATVEDRIQQKVAELWTHDAAVRTARDGYFRPTWALHCREMKKLQLRIGAPSGGGEGSGGGASTDSETDRRRNA